MNFKIKNIFDKRMIPTLLVVILIFVFLAPFVYHKICFCQEYYKALGFPVFFQPGLQFDDEIYRAHFNVFNFFVNLIIIILVSFLILRSRFYKKK